MLKIKKGDTVKVIAGKDKDKEGKVIAVNAKKNTVTVEGINMVTKHAVPPITLEIGSAQNTPSVPRFPIIGSSMVNGMTMMTFRNREKKTACFARFNATAVDCPANCSAIIKIPQK